MEPGWTAWNVIVTAIGGGLLAAALWCLVMQLAKWLTKHYFED